MGLNIRTLATIILLAALLLLFIPGDRVENLPLVKSLHIPAVQTAFRTQVAQGFDSARKAARSFINGIVERTLNSAEKRVQDQVEQEFNSIEEGIKDKVDNI